MFFRVSVLQVYNYADVDFTRADMYNTIRTYLTSGSTTATWFLLPLLFFSNNGKFFGCCCNCSQHAEML